MPARVVIIGAGWAGLAAAKTYLAVSPSVDLTILSDDTTVGGVWSQRRLYPGLIANLPNGFYEYSDFSMVDATHAKYDLIPGEQVRSYLEKYAIKHDLLRRILFETKVLKALTTSNPAHEMLTCDKLIVASGLHSKPNLPPIPRDSYTGTALHSYRLGQMHEVISSNPSITDIVVVGGCKSAVEAASIFLQPSISPAKHIHWVVRPSEQGVPIIVIDPNTRPSPLAAVTTRLFGALGPSIFATTGFWYRFLHSRRSLVGNKLYVGFWKLMTWAVRGPVKYDDSENGRQIKPQTSSMFWDSPYLSLIYTTNPWLSWLKDGSKMDVYRETPLRLHNKIMQLQRLDRTTHDIPCDAVIFCTGWQPNIDFFEPAEVIRLGFATPIADVYTDPAFTQKWSSLMIEADEYVTKLFPNLTRPSPLSNQTPHPYRLYRQILPPSSSPSTPPSLAFIGYTSTGQTAITDELASLWAVAHLESLLPSNSLASQSEMERETARVNAWMSRRYGARGAKKPEIVLEIQSYLDTLLHDLGVEVHRKKGDGWLGGAAEWLTPYVAADYAGIIQEFLDKVKKNK